ncbi:hypothetical protein F0L74_09785 [Chitinophaga agrisoli]|uniref:Uncharacterized protein n=1 Tax=Chitinophaga agrisoli TaxID=2607653 RepID=A0A5B2VXQ2_9BACT|nr:hypothetical protein F0L74_09785 [Chitinophaga agrisoli]
MDKIKIYHKYNEGLKGGRLTIYYDKRPFSLEWKDSPQSEAHYEEWGCGQMDYSKDALVSEVIAYAAGNGVRLTSDHFDNWTTQGLDFNLKQGAIL